MKQLTSIVAISVIILFTIVIYTSCQNADVSKPSNSLVGTWKIIEITDDGKKYDEIGYTTFTLGGFWSVQLKTPNPLNLTTAPETLEEYKAVLSSYKAGFGSYKIDGDSCKLYGTYDLKPQYIGNVVRGKYQVANDTLIIDVHNWRYTFIKQD